MSFASDVKFTARLERATAKQIPSLSSTIDRIRSLYDINLKLVTMLLDQRKLDFAYEQIVQDAAKARGACTVMIFVAPNCDAMCACRILSYMLRADAVSYKIKPVAGYGDITVANDELLKVGCNNRQGIDSKLRYWDHRLHGQL